jgi:ribonuclease J
MNIKNKSFRGFKTNSELISRKESYITPLKDDNIRIVNLGGTEECGKNMTAIEWRDSIIVINSGVQFSSSATPGVDYVIPNIKYLEDNKDKIKSFIITSSNLEYSGSIPFMLSMLNNPRVYGRLYTNTLIDKRFNALGIENLSEFVPVEEEMSISMGDFEVKFISINPLLADTLSIQIFTPNGDIIFTSDTKNLDLSNIAPNENRLFIAESMNIENIGADITYASVSTKLSDIISTRTGTVMFATFANNIYHLLKIVELTRKYNKKIIIDSKTCRLSIASAQETGLLGDIKDILIDSSEFNKYNRSEIILLISGNEGREFDNLYKIIQKDNANYSITEGDHVVIATHPIIHNQRTAQSTKDELSRLGAIIHHFKYGDILYSPCAGHDELNTLHAKLMPKFFLPIAGCHYMLRVHSDIERKIGAPENHIIIPDNGMLIELRSDFSRITNTREKAESEIVVVDGNKIGKLHSVVIKDRETLGAQGIFFTIILIDMKNHKLKKVPDIATRGFVFLNDSQDLITNVKSIISETTNSYLSKNRHIEIDDLKADLQNVLQKYLLQKTAKDPVAIPLIIKV